MKSDTRAPPRGNRGSVTRVTSGRDIRRQLTFELSDLVLEVKLALLEALQLQLILDGILREAGYDVIEVSVLEVQLVDTLPEHFAVGRMHHGMGPPYRLDEASIDRKKTKNEKCRGAYAGAKSARFFPERETAGRPCRVAMRRQECRWF
jgi:hypothetical protein